MKAAHAFSPSQRRNALAAFLFAKLFLCACGVKEKAVLDSGEAHGYNVGASIYEQARASPRASLREGGGFCEAKDGRSKRNEKFIQT